MKISTRLYLIEPGIIDIENTLASDFVSDNIGCIMFAQSEGLSIMIEKSAFQRCKSNANDHGGVICIKAANEVLLCYTCFSQNYCLTTPDIIVWGTSDQIISSSNINSTSFCRSTTASYEHSCSNWFRAKSLILHTLNISSMEAKIRCSAISFGAITSTIPITKYLLIENCSTANYVIEIYSYYTVHQTLDRFIVKDCGAAKAVMGIIENSYQINFKESIFIDIICNKWKDSNTLTVTFKSSSFNNCPSTSGYSSIGEATVWNTVWPNFSKCKMNNDEFCQTNIKFKHQKLKLVISLLWLLNIVYFYVDIILKFLLSYQIKMRNSICHDTFPILYKQC